MGNINPPYEPTDPLPPAPRSATRMIVYCDVNLLAFAREYDVDQTTALSMAQADVREWITEVVMRLNSAPKWQHIGAWGVK
jgi:hypothetical protein